MSDEPGRGYAITDGPLPLTVIIGGSAIIAGLVVTVDPRAIPYLLPVGLLGLGGALAEDLHSGRIRYPRITLARETPGKRLAAAAVVTAVALLASVIVALAAGIGSPLLVAVVAVAGVAWLAGIGIRRFVMPPEAAGQLRTRLGRIDRPTWHVLGFATVLFVVFAGYTSWLYTAYWMGGSDLGAYVHMFSTTLDGDGLLLHGKYRVSQPQGSYWGGHFSLTLFGFLPLYALVPSPLTLLFAKSAVVAASIPLVWLLAREYIADDMVAGLVTLSYGLNPFLWSAWLFDFQEQALLPLLLFGTFLAYRRDQRSVFVVLSVLVFLTNEFAILVFAGGLVGLVVGASPAERRDRASTLALTGGAALIVFVVAGMITAQFSVDAGIPYRSIADPFKPSLTTRTGIFELLVIVLSEPAALLEAFSIDLTRKILFFIGLLVPVILLALNDEVSVGALLPYLGFAWFIAGREIYYMFGAHYPFYLLPFIYVGTIRVLGRIEIDTNSRGLLRRLFVTIMLLNVFAGIAVGASHGVLPVQSDGEHTRVLETAIDEVPEGASLLTQNDIYPHVATRPDATYVRRPEMFNQYQRAYGPVTPAYVLLDSGLTARPNDWSDPVRHALGDRLETEYGLYRCQDGVALYKRGYTGDVQGLTRPSPGRC